MFSIAQNKLSGALAALKKPFTTVALFSCFINLAMLVGPLYMLQVYDRVLTSHSVDTLIMLSVIAGSLLVLAALVEAARSRLLVRAGAKLDIALREPLFAKALGSAREQAAGSRPLRDLEKLRTFLTGPGLLAFFDAPWAPIYLAAIYLLHPTLGHIALAGALIIVCLACIGEFLSRPPLGQSGLARHLATQVAEQVSRNRDTVLAMGMTANLRTRWIGLHDASVAWQALASDRLGTIRALAKFVRLGLQIAVLGIGAWLALQGALSPGAMVAASIIMGRALAPVEAAIGHWRGVIEARAAHKRLSGDLAAYREESDRTTLPAPTGRITAENVIVRHEGQDEPALQFVSFRLEPGEMLGVIGPSGSGKSTLARLLVGACAPNAGSIRLDSAEISKWPTHDLGKYLGYLPQNAELLPGTVAENICRFGANQPDRVLQAAKLAGAHDMILRLPGAYDTEIGENGTGLSGGERQLVALARAVYGASPLVVLDEPNSALDGNGEQALAKTLARLKSRGQTVIVISHRPSVLGAVDKVLTLQGGRVAFFGSREEVIQALPKPVVPISNGKTNASAKTPAAANGAVRPHGGATRHREHEDARA